MKVVSYFVALGVCDTRGHSKSINAAAAALSCARIGPRFNFALYVPPAEGKNTAILVARHGTGRRISGMRDAFAEFGRY